MRGLSRRRFSPGRFPAQLAVKVFGMDVTVPSLIPSAGDLANGHRDALFQQPGETENDAAFGLRHNTVRVDGDAGVDGRPEPVDTDPAICRLIPNARAAPKRAGYAHPHLRAERVRARQMCGLMSPCLFSKWSSRRCSHWRMARTSLCAIELTH